MRYYLSGAILLTTLAMGQAAPQPPSPPDESSQAQTDAATVFSSARSRLLADANRMPRYTCLQNITRHFYPSTSEEPRSCAVILAKRTQRKHDPPASSWDRLQLDVAIADSREVHSWPGAPKFNEDEIRKLVNNGPFGSGDFSAFVAGIFGGPATIKFAGSRSVNGRTLFQYSFAVTNTASRYQIATSSANVITAYQGWFLLDPQTADLVQLTVRTAELPEATQACQALSEIQYRRIAIHGRQVLIPEETDLRIIYRSGREAVAATSYSNCHEYASKSIMRFDNTDVGAAKAALLSQEPALHAPSSPFPDGLTFDCRIVTPIDSETPAGLPIAAVLRAPLRDKNKSVLAPRGARIHGRLVRLAAHKGALDYFEVGVRLESIEVNGAEVPLHARLTDQQAPPVNYLDWEDRKALLADFPSAPPRNVGIFFFVREKLHLRQIDSSWTTISSETDGEKEAAPKLEAQKQTEEKELKKLILATNYSQHAIDLQNSMPSSQTGGFCDFPNLADILTFRRKAIETAESANTDVLNRLYPELGVKFKSEFLESLSLFVHGCAMQSQFDGLMGREVGQSRLLAQEWADWYGAHRKDIEEAVNLRQLDSEWNQHGVAQPPSDPSPSR